MKPVTKLRLWNLMRITLWPSVVVFFALFGLASFLNNKHGGRYAHPEIACVATVSTLFMAYGIFIFIVMWDDMKLIKDWMKLLGDSRFRHGAMSVSDFPEGLKRDELNLMERWMAAGLAYSDFRRGLTEEEFSRIELWVKAGLAYADFPNTETKRKKLRIWMRGKLEEKARTAKKWEMARKHFRSVLDKLKYNTPSQDEEQVVDPAQLREWEEKLSAKQRTHGAEVWTAEEYLELAQYKTNFAYNDYHLWWKLSEALGIVTEKYHGKRDAPQQFQKAVTKDMFLTEEQLNAIYLEHEPSAHKANLHAF